MAPVENAFKAEWPEAKRTNLLDDSLAGDRERAGALTPEMSARILSLARYAVDSGAAGVLFTCSAFGEAIEAAAAGLPTPVLKPNEAMFDAALDKGGRIGMLATFAPAVASMEEEFKEIAQKRGSAARLETICVLGAREALMAGNFEKHDELVAAAAPKLAHCDAIMLAHFSTATAAERTQQNVARPVLTAPTSAVLKLRSALTKKDAA
jgi:hypothetical protein